MDGCLRMIPRTHLQPSLTQLLDHPTVSLQLGSTFSVAADTANTKTAHTDAIDFIDTNAIFNSVSKSARTNDKIIPVQANRFVKKDGDKDLVDAVTVDEIFYTVSRKLYKLYNCACKIIFSLLLYLQSCVYVRE